MPMPSIDSGRTPSAIVARIVTLVAILLACLASVVVVVLSPVLLNSLDWGGRDWSRLGEIGQTYGLVSAVLSAAALFVVVLMQRHQIRHERVSMTRDLHITIVQTALQDPSYAQCWGPRMTPPGIEERHFYYCNMILLLWLYSWEIGEIGDAQVRSYARNMFDSELPREYWRQFGDWRLSGERGHRRRFLVLIDEQFREAEATGPPARRLERAGPPVTRTGVQRRSRAPRRGYSVRRNRISARH
jgi:hypothetical protein